MIRRLVEHGCGSSRCALWASVAWCFEEKTESVLCLLSCFDIQYAFVAESSSCIHSSGRTWRPDLSLQWNLLHIDLRSIYRLGVLPSCSGPGDGSLLVPPSLSNVSRPGLSDILLCCIAALYFISCTTCFGWWPSNPSTATEGTTFNNSIHSIHSLAPAPLFCDVNVCFKWFSASQLHFGKGRNRCKAIVKKGQPQCRSGTTTKIAKEGGSG